MNDEIAHPVINVLMILEYFESQLSYGLNGGMALDSQTKEYKFEFRRVKTEINNILYRI